MGGVAETQDADLGRLTRHVTVPGASEPFGAYVFGFDEPGAELGRQLERKVFLEAFGNTAELLAEEYAPYERTSAFICVVDHLRARPAGVMRLLLPSPAGFKSLNDVEPLWGEPAAALADRTGLAIDPFTTWDIATFAVAPEYRGKAARGLVTMGLYQTLTLAALATGTEWFVAILDMPVFRLLRWKLRMIFAGYKGVAPLPYLGSPASIPAWCNVGDAERHLAAADPDLHAIVCRGEGLEAAVRPVDLACADRLLAWRSEAAAG
jgi:hypothetical protein